MHSTRLLFSLLALNFLAAPSAVIAVDESAMLPSEAETLLALMESLSSDEDWRAEYPSPCSSGSMWKGMECKLGHDNRLHVSRLDFGTFPNPSCKETATFPSLIFSLPYLQSVFFLGCFTSTKTKLSVPLGSLNSTLQQLSLISNTALIGRIPTQLSSFRSLKTISLAQNRLSGGIPAGIFSITTLAQLDLSYNLLQGEIPNQLGNLKNLVVLDLSFNSFTGKIPTTIGQLGMLQKLDLSSNLIEGRIPDSVENLASLSFLALSNNRLQGYFPSGFFTLQNLEYLIMDDNPMFIPLPADLGNLGKLEELRLANSGYSGSIPEAFSKLVNLTTLSLQNNRLTGGIPSGFSSQSHLYHLNLSKNFLQGIVQLNATFFDRLGKNLDLRGNPGLCLSPSEQHNVNVEVGVSICRVSNNGSLAAATVESDHSPFPLLSASATQLSLAFTLYLLFLHC